MAHKFSNIHLNTSLSYILINMTIVFLACSISYVHPFNYQHYNKYLPHTFHSTAKLRFGLSSFTETLRAHRERE